MKHTIENMYSSEDFVIYSYGRINENAVEKEDGTFEHKRFVSGISFYQDDKKVTLYTRDILDLADKIKEIEKETYFDYPEY